MSSVYDGRSESLIAYAPNVSVGAVDKTMFDSWISLTMLAGFLLDNSNGGTSGTAGGVPPTWVLLRSTN